MRKMASIRKIIDIKKIENADKICIYLVDGWQIVDEVNKYKINDFVIMLEIDSWVPNALAPFLSKGKVPREFKKGFAIRGEIVGPGVNGNKLQLTEHDFYVFDLWEPIDGCCTPKERHLIVGVLGLKHVPLHHKFMTFSGTFEQLLESANGQSVLNPNVKREGLVFKSEDGQFTFKIVSNEWLLEFKE